MPLFKRPPAAPRSKARRYAASLGLEELRTWGETVGQYAAERCRKAALDVRDDVGEIRECAEALSAVADELESRLEVRARRA